MNTPEVEPQTSSPSYAQHQRGNFLLLMLVIALFCIAAAAQPAATGQFLLKIEPTRAGFTLQNMTAEEARLASQHVQYFK